jgi:hypothetical protein
VMRFGAQYVRAIVFQHGDFSLSSQKGGEGWGDEVWWNRAGRPSPTPSPRCAGRGSRGSLD